MKKEEKQVLPEITFEAQEFIFVEKTKDWYWILWIIFIAIAAGAFLISNPFFGVLVLLAAFVFSLLASKKPEIITVSFNDTHVQAGRKRYKTSEIESYKFIPEEARVLLKHTKPFLPLVVIPIGLHAPEGELRSYLNETPWEENDELQEPLLELLMEKFGF